MGLKDSLKEKMQNKMLEELTLGIMRKYVETRKSKFQSLLMTEEDDEERSDIVNNLEVMERMLDEINNYKGPI